MTTTYQNIAKSALKTWNGLTEEEANIKIKTETIKELEEQVYAMNSIKYAVVGITKQINLTEEEALTLFDAVINEKAQLTNFELILKKVQNLTNKQVLAVLSTIHDGKVKENSTEQIFNRKVVKQQLRQYAPLELIGWNEVKSDLLFLKPILNFIGVQVNDNQLAQSYHAIVADYMQQMNLNTQEDLTTLIKQGKAYYPVLPEELEKRLLPMSKIVSSQIIQNWNNKDLESLQIMQNRQQKLNSVKNI